MQLLAVVQTDPGVVELNYTWLPTWLGMNSSFKAQLEQDLKEKLVGLTLDESGLTQAHRLVVSYIASKFPELKGLEEYLDSIKYVSLP